jgi:predicted DNA-binding WGR domain protein
MTTQNEKVTLVQREGEHNKYWSYEIAPQPNGGFIVHTKWGRLGAANGQSKDFVYGHSYDAQRHARSKHDEKIRKGYHKISEEELNLLVARAKIVGLRFKPEQLEFVEPDPIEENVWNTVKDAGKLSNPDTKVSVWCRIRTPEGGYDILISEEEAVAFTMDNLHMVTDNMSGELKEASFRVKDKRNLQSLTDKAAKKLVEQIHPIVGTLF